MPWTIPRLRAAPSLVWNWGLYALRPTAFATQVVTFPLVRGPYPSYAGGHGTDDLSLFPKVKQWLDYLGFMTMDKLAGYDVQTTEGAEQGIGVQIAAMAAHIAQTTCNRDIYILMEAPAYGYDTGTAAWLANKAGDFKDCANDTDVTLSVKAWLPGTALPTAVGADGLTYSADSTSENSPWLESMVFPENPSGVVRARAAENTER